MLSSSAVSRIDELVQRCNFPDPGTPVSIGLSGGADSSALVALATHAGCVVNAIHVDHGVRPDSASEVAQVAGIAAQLGATFRSVRVDVPPGGNLEARARHARYEVLGEDALIGHTLDDRAETILLHLLRGTGTDGLAALHPPDPRRPMLALRRSETKALCSELDIDVFDDPSNTDPRFTRNRIRNELLPLMCAIARRDVAPLLVRTSDIAATDTAYLTALATNIDPHDAKKLAASPEPLASRALRQWLTSVHDGYVPDRKEIDRVMRVARGDARATQLVSGSIVTRHNQQLSIKVDREATE